MPIMYVNPAPRSGRRKTRRVKRGAAGRRVKPLSGVTVKKTSRRKARKNAARRAKRKGTRMARKKLYGAAAKSHAKRLARRRKRKNPAARARRRSRRARRNPARKRRRARKSSVAAHYHSGSRGYAAGMEAAAKPKRRRRRRKATAVSAPRRRRRKARAAAPKRRARRAAPRRLKRRSYGVKSLKRARRSIRRARRRGGLAGAYARRYRMRSNPRRRRGRRRHRRNPSLMQTPSMLMGIVKQALPVAASLYLTRFIIAKIGPKIMEHLPIPAQLQGPTIAGLMVVAANFATKRGPLAKWRSGIMLGTGLNLVDSLVRAFAPAEVKSMFGLGDSGMYDQAMGEFVSVGDYLEVGAQPIDDDIALSDYVETSGIEEELGAIQEELGVEEDLGDNGPRRLGGVSQSSMLKALKASSSVGVVPQRSFVRTVPHAGPGYDNPSTLYTGIFGGGF